MRRASPVSEKKKKKKKRKKKKKKKKKKKETSPLNRAGSPHINRPLEP